jgi:thymidylate kinase
MPVTSTTAVGRGVAREGGRGSPRGITVALLGADGAGKSSLLRDLPRMLPMSTSTLYMGVNLEASAVMLPTTRLVLALKRMRGRRPRMHAGPPTESSATPEGPAKRTADALKSGLRITNWIAEEWFRQAIVWWRQRRYDVVLLDRHFIADYYAYDVLAPGSSVGRRLHGYLLRRFYPRPTLAICLDAPPEVLRERAGEGSLEYLTKRRGEYLQLGDVFPHFHVVDTVRPREEVRSEVAGLITDFHRRHPGNRT